MNDLFSERYNYLAKRLQYEYINEHSKAHLWDEVNWYFLVKAKKMYEEDDAEFERDNSCLEHAIDFYYGIYRDFLGKSVDDFTIEPVQAQTTIKSYIMFTTWHNIFDAIEALIRLCPVLIPDNKKRKTYLKNFHVAINDVLEQQRCCYRLVNGNIVPQINNAEVVTIANALVDANPINAVNAHLELAIKYYSDRHNSDYKNAMKEAISALEALLRIIVNKPKLGMSYALKEIGKNKAFELHGSLQESLDKLYAWAGDASGVRHANKIDKTSESDVVPEYTIEDAKLIIITCCSFVSYLIAKANRAGIRLK